MDKENVLPIYFYFCRLSMMPFHKLTHCKKTLTKTVRSSCSYWGTTWRWGFWAVFFSRTFSVQPAVNVALQWCTQFCVFHRPPSHLLTVVFPAVEVRLPGWGRGSRGQRLSQTLAPSCPLSTCQHPDSSSSWSSTNIPCHDHLTFLFYFFAYKFNITGHAPSRSSFLTAVGKEREGGRTIRNMWEVGTGCIQIRWKSVRCGSFVC